MDDDDPGWPPKVFVPIAFRRRGDRQGDGLLALRQLFVAFCVAVALFGLVVAYLGAGQTKRPGVAVALVALVAVGVVSVAAGTVDRPLTCTDTNTLRTSYVNRFFIRIAFAEAPTLVGFAGDFFTGERWLYFVAAVITYAGFARAAPSRGHLRRDQERLHRQGCHLSLVAALRSAPRPRRN